MALFYFGLGDDAERVASREPRRLLRLPGGLRPAGRCRGGEGRRHGEAVHRRLRGRRCGRRHLLPHLDRSRRSRAAGGGCALGRAVGGALSPASEPCASQLARRWHIACRMADAADFDSFYRRESEGVLVFLARRTFDAEVALELTAETFSRAYVGWRGVRGESPQERQAWVYTIARRTPRALPAPRAGGTQGAAEARDPAAEHARRRPRADRRAGGAARACATSSPSSSRVSATSSAGRSS